MRTRSNNRERGGALLAVLWMSAALAAIAFSVSTTVRGEIDRVASDTDGLRTHYLATGAVQRGIQWMLWRWQEGDYRNPDGSPRFWDATRPRLFMQFPTGDAIVEVIPESAKLNINYASPDDLAKVIAAVGGPEAPVRDIATAIVEWRTGGSTLDPLYLSINPTFRPRHASFQEIEELLSVRGMTPELFYGNFLADAEGRLYARGGLRDCLSVWGSVGPFDANFASPALMEATGVPPDQIARLMELRKIRVFRNPGELRDVGITSPRLATGGNYIWTLRATARLKRPDGRPSEVVRTSAATVKLLRTDRYFPMPLHVLRTYSDAWSEFAVAPPAAPVQLLQ
jgi:general secretion pathway protein K